jgi:acid phosphatase type 7
MILTKQKTWLLLSVLFLMLTPALAHVGDHPSVHDTVANVIERMRKSKNPAEVRDWNSSQVENFLTASERTVLAEEHIRFEINVPVTLYVVRTKEPVEELYWLKARNFATNQVEWTERNEQLRIWAREFAPGSIGLGVNSLWGGGNHYVVLLAPKNPLEHIEVKNLYPGQLRLTQLTNGVKPYVDNDVTLTNVPPALEGLTLIQTQQSQRDAAKLVDIFRITEHPATVQPDQIILTWSADPKSTQTIQWRTSKDVSKGFVLFGRKKDSSALRSGSFKPEKIKAKSERLDTLNVINDPTVFHHTATLSNLQPDTTYIYRVGDGSSSHWSEEFEFTTAPSRTEPFSFIYMGDAQNGLDRWGTLLQNGFRQRPDAAFYIMAGDLVNRGADRDDWDSLFYNSSGVYDRRQLVPVMGNHECQGGHPTLYLKQFALPTNGPVNIEKERAYSFEYSNALFVVLDSNLPAASQTNWLEQVLSSSKATWKFVTYHHPAYSSGPKRDNASIRELWTPIFDKYEVDLALQGHDHAYLRTYPMHGQKRAGEKQKGTVYIVSVSGTKHYEQDPRDYTEFGMTNVSTYQVLDIQISGDRLVYRAYDIDGALRDELVIEKKPRP